MKKLIFSSVVAASSVAFAQTPPPPVPPPVGIPAGWNCVKKTATSGQEYQVCSPPTGGTGTPFFLWTKKPEVQK